MHLLVFIHSLSSGGAERVTSQLANYWAEKGWNITVVTMTENEQDFYSLHHNIKRISLGLGTESKGFLQAVLHNFQRIDALRTLLKKQKPDVALAMMTTANILLSLAAIGLPVPVVGSERIHPPTLPLGLIWDWLRRQCYGQLTMIVAQTEESAKWLKVHTKVKKIEVIPNAVSYPIEPHPPIVKPNWHNRDGFNLIAVGRLSNQKGFERLLSIFSILSSRFPDWNLTILGEGDCRQSLEQQRKALGLELRVSMPGVVGNLDDWYKSSDLFVMTSLFEGFPNTLVEAMAYGLPVVSVDCDTGPRDIIRHKIDGLLVPQNDPEALVSALTELMSNKSLRQQYASHAIEIRERLSMAKIASVWEKLFLDLAKESTSSI